MSMTYEQALADATRALRECFPDRAQAILDALRTKSPAPFTARPSPDSFVLSIHATHPGGPLERMDLLRAANSRAIVTDNMMPTDWRTDELYGACNASYPTDLMLTERVNGIEVARHPLGAFLGLQHFDRVYDRHCTYGLELSKITPGDVAPFEIALSMSGRRLDRRTELVDFMDSGSSSSLSGSTFFGRSFARLGRRVDRARRDAARDVVTQKRRRKKTRT